MEWLHSISYFLGGAFLANAIPHYISGVMGRSFQSPFSKPPGQGLSSSTVNVFWGCLNFIIAYLLIDRVGNFSFHSTSDMTSTGLGILLISLLCARLFGRFHGGNSLKT